MLEYCGIRLREQEANPTRSQTEGSVAVPLTVDFARNNDLQAIIRGLRAVSDFEYEFQLATMNRHLTEQIETVFLTPTENFTFVSSSLVREVAQFGGDISSFVRPHVAVALKTKFGN